MQHYTDPKLYDEIVKDWEYRFPKFNINNYPKPPEQQSKQYQHNPSTNELKPKHKFPPDK